MILKQDENNMIKNQYEYANYLGIFAYLFKIKDSFSF